MIKLKLTGMLLGVFLVTANAYAGGIGNYSNGWRMGSIDKFSVKGLFTKSGEGQMLMGRESSPYQITSGSGDSKTTKIINPWYFSSSSSYEHLWSKLSNIVGSYVVIKYSQSHFKALNVDTDYEVLSIEKPTKHFDEICTAKTYNKGSNSLGTRAGRIVKASVKGTVSNSYEIMLQQGNAGNQFKNMSISSDKSLYNCAIRALKSAKKVKITYNESIINLDIFGRNTAYDIVQIEPVDDI